MGCGVSQLSKGHASADADRDDMRTADDVFKSQFLGEMDHMYEHLDDDDYRVDENPSCPFPPPLLRERHLVYSTGRVIGHGAFGKVFLATEHLTGKLLAAKEMLVENSGKEIVEALDAETRLLVNLRHQSIVKIHDLFLTMRPDPSAPSAPPQPEKLTVVMDYLPGGNLASLTREFGGIPEVLCRRYVRQVLDGLSLMQRYHVAHLDLKCANLMLDSDGNVRIVDFGTAIRLIKQRATHAQPQPHKRHPNARTHARAHAPPHTRRSTRLRDGAADLSVVSDAPTQLSESAPLSRAETDTAAPSESQDVSQSNDASAAAGASPPEHEVQGSDSTAQATATAAAAAAGTADVDRASKLGIRGSPYWLAPECVKTTDYDIFKVDVWSLGCTIVEMLEMYPPFFQFKQVPSLLYHIATITEPPDIPARLSEEGKDFLRRCLVLDPEGRSSVESLLTHSWVSKVNARQAINPLVPDDHDDIEIAPGQIAQSMDVSEAALTMSKADKVMNLFGRSKLVPDASTRSVRQSTMAASRRVTDRERRDTRRSIFRTEGPSCEELEGLFEVVVPVENFDSVFARHDALYVKYV